MHRSQTCYFKYPSKSFCYYYPWSKERLKTIFFLPEISHFCLRLLIYNKKGRRWAASNVTFGLFSEHRFFTVWEMLISFLNVAVVDGFSKMLFYALDQTHCAFVACNSKRKSFHKEFSYVQFIRTGYNYYVAHLWIVVTALTRFSA